LVTFKAYIIIFKICHVYFNKFLVDWTGREQADMTGLRLKRMNLSYDSITHSTMDRAVETAQIIHRRLQSTVPLPLATDEMIIAGAPIPPNPTLSYWKFPDRVRIILKAECLLILAMKIII